MSQALVNCNVNSVFGFFEILAIVSLGKQMFIYFSLKLILSCSNLTVI